MLHIQCLTKTTKNEFVKRQYLHELMKKRKLKQKKEKKSKKNKKKKHYLKQTNSIEKLPRFVAFL